MAMRHPKGMSPARLRMLEEKAAMLDTLMMLAGDQVSDICTDLRKEADIILLAEKIDRYYPQRLDLKSIGHYSD